MVCERSFKGTFARAAHRPNALWDDPPQSCKDLHDDDDDDDDDDASSSASLNQGTVASHCVPRLAPVIIGERNRGKFASLPPC
eukprot:1443500-Amphidinium_carterae.1